MGPLIQQSHGLLLVSLVLLQSDVVRTINVLYGVNVYESNKNFTDNIMKDAHTREFSSMENVVDTIERPENNLPIYSSDTVEFSQDVDEDNFSDYGNSVDDGDTDHEEEVLSDGDDVHNFVPKANLIRFKNLRTCISNCFLTTCHCRSLELNNVPQNLSTAITFLDLYENNIRTLRNKPFCGYPKLNLLILEKNKLTNLDNDSFSCLSKLIYLNLRSNQLKMVKGVFPKGVFSPLLSLFNLDLQKNNPNSTHVGYDYPDEALAYLKNLRALNIDGINNKTFGPGFGNMTSLRSLSLSGFDGFCTMIDLDNSMFEFLGQLRLLNISSCWISKQSVTENIFAPLKQLAMLDIQNNFLLGYKGFRLAMASLKNSSLKVLIANSVLSRYALSCTINIESAEVLPKTLVYLEARENCFEYFHHGVFSIIPKGLRYVDVGSNRFVFGEYLRDLHKLENLEVLKLNGGGVLTKVPQTYPHSTQGISLSSIDSYSRSYFLESDNFELQLPEKLKLIDLSIAGLKYELSSLVVNPNNSLESLILSNNYFPVISGPFIGFNKLRVLDLSHGSIGEISPQFFENFPALEKLDLAHNKLGGFFAKQSKHMSVFEKLTNLKNLALTANGLTIITYNIFKGLDNLEKLSLNENSNWHFNVNVSHMTKLKVLNLTDTEITGLPKHVRDHIDSLKNDIEVDLSHCPLHCECQNLDFLRWMVRSNAFDKTFRDYLCFYEDATFRNITDQFAATLRVLEGQCAENYTLFLLVLSTTLCMMCFVVGGIVYRFRWKLRYLYYMVYRNKEKENRQKSGIYKYDVFISYASKDERFVINEVMKELSARGLKLHVHGRDFAVGEYIACNIITAIHESRKTLVVLTRKLLDSDWCNYELQMANMESVHTGREVLVFLLKESIPSRDLGTDLLYHIRKSTYILYPQSDGVKDERLIQAFWDKLAMDLGQT